MEINFIPSPEGSRSLGFGSVKISGFSINFNVYRSPQSESGIFVGLPSRKKFIDGKEVLKADGKPEYISEVYIYDKETRIALDEAVKNSMANHGIRVDSGSPPPSHTFNVTAKTQAPTIATAPSQPVDEDEELPF